MNVKILNPGFFARTDTRTPVLTAVAALAFNIFLNIAVVRRFGIVGLAGATAASASLNCLLLYAMLHKRGWFRFTWRLAGRVGRQVLATALMAALLWWLTPLLADRYAGTALERAWSLAVLVGSGMAVFFAAAFAFGAIDKSVLAQLRRRRPARTAADDEILEAE